MEALYGRHSSYLTVLTDYSIQNYITMHLPTLSPNLDPALRRMDRAIELFTILLFGCLTLMVCCSCGSTKVATQLVERTSVDTVYLSNMQYDSIYII